MTAENTFWQCMSNPKKDCTNNNHCNSGDCCGMLHSNDIVKKHMGYICVPEEHDGMDMTIEMYDESIMNVSVTCSTVGKAMEGRDGGGSNRFTKVLVGFLFFILIGITVVIIFRKKFGIDFWKKK